MAAWKVLIPILFVILIPIVSALSLANMPLLLIAPMIIMALFVIIFVIMIIKDKMAMKSLAIPTFDNIGKTKEDKKIEPEIEKKTTDYYLNIRELETKIDRQKTEETYKSLMKIIRKFFTDYLNINYEFTYEELEKELKNKKKKVVFFADKLSKIEYGPHPISRKTLIKIMTEFKHMIKTAQNQTIANKNYTNEEKKIKGLIKKGKKIAHKNPKEAANIYDEIYTQYYQFPAAVKRKYQEPVKELYKLMFN
ncbi:MAG: hypothetical protein ABIC04_04700 [Nanoarchaeota archaeon]